MAQENANILHAAIQIRDQQPADPLLIAQTGLDAASVKLRTDLAGIAPVVLEVDLVAGIDDSELFVAWMSGTVEAPHIVGDDPPVNTATLNLLPDNIMRPNEVSDANNEKRRFWIAMPGSHHDFYVSWWRIPQTAASVIPIV